MQRTGLLFRVEAVHFLADLQNQEEPAEETLLYAYPQDKGCAQKLTMAYTKMHDKSILGNEHGLFLGGRPAGELISSF